QVKLVRSSRTQQIRGEHLVRPDGTISLGTYGRVPVANTTVAQARAAIELHLSQYLVDPHISLELWMFNTKKYYLIIDEGKSGEQVIPRPLTGRTTVYDALHNLRDVQKLLDSATIQLDRSWDALNANLTLVVDWPAIQRDRQHQTNYEVRAEDRIR